MKFKQVILSKLNSNFQIFTAFGTGAHSERNSPRYYTDLDCFSVYVDQVTVWQLIKISLTWPLAAKRGGSITACPFYWQRPRSILSMLNSINQSSGWSATCLVFSHISNGPYFFSINAFQIPFHTFILLYLTQVNGHRFKRKIDWSIIRVIA